MSGFQELEKLQSDSPTGAKESLKLLITLAANNDFDMASVDRKAAFLQAKTLDREVFMKPPKDQRVEGWLWKLKKPLYGLDDTSRMFWFRVKETLVALG